MPVFGSSVLKRDGKPSPVSKRLHFHPEETSFSSDANMDDISPRRTRSGKVYDNYERPPCRSSIICPPKPVFGPEVPITSSSISSLISSSSFTPIFSTPKTSPDKFGKASRHPLLLVTEDSESEKPSAPPPLNYARRPMSRISSCLNITPELLPPESSSPPTNGVMALRLFDSPTPDSEHLGPQYFPLHKKFFFASERKSSGPFFSEPPKRRRHVSSSSAKLSNINPFTPEALLFVSLKRSRRANNRLSPNGGSFSELQKSLDTMSDGSDDENETSSLGDLRPPSAKRICVSDIHISRYSTEFIELRALSSGEYGSVKLARHRLDGMVYAIKITKKVIQPNSHEEHVAMNEVFAHAALMKHKHVVRYYNSWVEYCQVYIQTEYCEGGSLHAQIKAHQKRNQRFPESELRTLLNQIAKGLHYIHGKGLVHLDIKPENIFIALEHASSTSPVAPPPPNSLRDPEASGDESTDSGNHSGNDNISHLKGDERLVYRIGDLGNIAQIYGDYLPEEGDCRYMAPELLLHNLEREKLPKVDVFSLGLTLYAAASLTDLPKNSLDDPILYDRLKRGDLPYLEDYSSEFNAILKSLVHPDASSRPTPYKLSTSGCLSAPLATTPPLTLKSRAQMSKYLKSLKNQVRHVEDLLSQNTLLSSNKTTIPSLGPSLRSVGKGTPRSSSCIL